MDAPWELIWSQYSRANCSAQSIVSASIGQYASHIFKTDCDTQSKNLPKGRCIIHNNFIL
jgi:hypothetical protein